MLCLRYPAACARAPSVLCEDEEGQSSGVHPGHVYGHIEMCSIDVLYLCRALYVSQSMARKAYAVPGLKETSLTPILFPQVGRKPFQVNPLPCEDVVYNIRRMHVSYSGYSSALTAVTRFESEFLAACREIPCLSKQPTTFRGAERCTTDS